MLCLLVGGPKRRLQRSAVVGILQREGNQRKQNHKVMESGHHLTTHELDLIQQVILRTGIQQIKPQTALQTVCWESSHVRQIWYCKGSDNWTTLDSQLTAAYWNLQPDPTIFIRYKQVPKFQTHSNDHGTMQNFSADKEPENPQLTWERQSTDANGTMAKLGISIAFKEALSKWSRKQLKL